MRIITAAKVLTGPDLETLERGAVVVEGDRIAWVGPEADLPREYDGVEALDLGELTLLPGLIDAHVHLGFDGGPNPVARMMAENDARQVATMLRSARELLSAGVTTARDLGSRDLLGVDVREAILDGTADGPRMLIAGPAITVTGGHCWFMNGEVDSPEEMRRMVRRLHKGTVDCFKVMSTGGNMTPGSAPWHAQFPEDDLAIAVEEAHRLGKTIAAHAHGVEGIRRALAAGVDTIEHCSFQTQDGSDGYDEELGAAIAASNTAVSPTCSARMKDFMRLMPWRRFALGDLYRAGATIIASTDSGIDNNPHWAFVYALEAMLMTGMSARDVLLSATSVSARVLGIDHVAGSIAPGLSADLLAVAGDPREDIAVLHDLRLIVARGRDFAPDPLPAFEPLDDDNLPEMFRRMLDAHAAEPQPEPAEVV
ncbi:amidohydrolase family protein [Microbacterium sediminis]|uniref:amidohydrolase family protein n=1 Tax=Microbacterium sediminis TaxID=904291 RepID=UPI00107250C3|nr:amidohydrolase family protein [Microbacterium sediminis]QBR73016.1 amidohydrolase family protein [Microbacterium sediminis]